MAYRGVAYKVHPTPAFSPRRLTPPSRGRSQAGFAHLRPPLTSNVRPIGKSTVESSMTSRAEVQTLFEASLKKIACPNCGLQYTDHAVAWCNGWMDGRQDLMREIGGQERDGPVSIRCELCDAKSSINYFSKVATLVSGGEKT
jgi:hypothetical protein